MKKPKLSPKLKLKNPIKRRLGAEARVTEAFANVPRITNDTVAEHREEVLAGARKFIYPLQHSKHRVVRTSAILLVTALIAFFSYVGLALYRFQSTSTFLYDVTRVIPLPVAKAGSKWVSYESYLFELKRNMHYYHTQQHIDFSAPNGKPQLARLKTQAMNSVIQAAYVKELAAPKGIHVTDQEVHDQVALVRSQNRLGSNDRVFKDVLNEFWGWSVTDFERELRQQLLQQKVASTLDTVSLDRANSVLKQVQGGADFAALATANSDDAATKTNGGQYPNPILRSDHAVPPQLAAAFFSLKANETSGLITSGYTREIIKVIDTNGSSVHAAHIQFNIKDIDSRIKPLAAKQPSHQYIKI
ncbi:MAG: peptidylprolyl isomerase [Patescibacteria group bacterium]|nr:peptidylprolyl isomerase [Patescibacteria group bacterium]